jgi:hypothetical protein
MKTVKTQLTAQDGGINNEEAKVQISWDEPSRNVKDRFVDSKICQ